MQQDGQKFQIIKCNESINSQMATQTKHEKKEFNRFRNPQFSVSLEASSARDAVSCTVHRHCTISAAHHPASKAVSG